MGSWSGRGAEEGMAVDVDGEAGSRGFRGHCWM